MLRRLSQRATPHSELGARGAPYPPAGHPLPRGARVLLAAPLAIFPCPSSPRPFGERARVRGPPLRSAKLIPAPAFGPILAASPRKTRGRDERLARGRSGYPGRRILAEDETGVDDCRRAEPVWCWTFLPAPPGPARPRVPPSRMAWAAAAPTARRQASSASARRARRRHPSQKAQWGTPVAASAQQTRSRRRGSVSPNADYPLRDGASPTPAFPAGVPRNVRVAPDGLYCAGNCLSGIGQAISASTPLLRR